jgi:serine kinase of HPr protein (carbohydrate metabolism regulator)
MNTVLANVSCVAVDGAEGPRAVLIEGGPGSGKSSLALALIDRGAVLIGDDGVTLAPAGERLLASPPPKIAGMIEVRNVGLVRLATASAPLALVVRLDEGAPRHVDAAQRVERAGRAIPLLALHPASPILALRVEYALKTHGLA